MKLSERSASSAQQCPLCTEAPISNPSRLQQHLAGHLRRLSLFVLPGAEIDVNTQGREYDNALDEMDDVNNLLIRGSNIEEMHEGNRPLLYAVKRKKIAAVKILRYHEPALDVDKPGRDGETPLAIASYSRWVLRLMGRPPTG